MPYRSEKQRKFFNENPEKVGGQKVVDEFNKATKGLTLPNKIVKVPKGYIRGIKGIKPK